MNIVDIRTPITAMNYDTPSPVLQRCSRIKLPAEFLTPDLCYHSRLLEESMP